MNKLKKALKIEYLPFIILFCLLFIYFSSVDYTTGDYIFFKNATKFSEVFNWMIFRYNTWSSRNLIELVLVLLCKLPSQFWIISTSLIMILFDYMILKLFSKFTLKNSLLIVSLSIILLSFDFSSAGFVATTTNYLFPGTIGLVAIYPIKKVLENKKISKFEYLLYSLCTLYAANQEQVACILVTTYLFFVFYLHKKNKLRPIILSQLALSIISLIYILLCPGNSVRLIQESNTWNPNYLQLSFFDKIDVAITNVIKYYFNPNILLLIFTALISLIIVKKYHKRLFSIISLIPFSTVLIFGPLKNIFSFYFPRIEALSLIGNKTGILNIFYSITNSGVIIFVFGCLVLLSILFSLYLLFDSEDKSFLAMLIFLLGIGTKFMLGFSPTVLDSLERTTFFMLVSIIILIYMTLTEQYKKNISENLLFFDYFIIISALFTYLSIILI